MRKCIWTVFLTFLILALGVSLSAQNTGNQGNYASDAYAQGLHDGKLATSTNYWWGAGSFCTGCVVGGVMPISLGWGLPVVTAAAGSIPIIGAAVTTPSPNASLMMAMGNRDPQYIEGFRQGYGKSQKSKNVRNAALGMGIAVIISIGTVFYLSSL